MRKARLGGAMVELAVCLPMLMSLTMGSLETCRFLYVKQSAKIAAYECARLGIVPGATEEDVRDLCTVVLQNRKLKNFEVYFHPSDLSALVYGSPLTVTVDLPLPDNMPMGSWFFSEKRLVQTVQMMGEY